MMKINPYRAGNPVGGSDVFIGRADILREVVRVLRNPDQKALVLYGQRRIGKTSILQRLAAQLPKERYCSIPFNLQNKATWTLSDVLNELAQTIAQGLGCPIPNLKPDPRSSFRNEWFPGILTGLPTNLSLVILFDEVDVLADPETGQAATAFFPYLHDLITSDLQKFKFIFVIGRNIDDLDNIALSLFKDIPAFRVSLLNREDTIELVRIAEANNTLHWSDEAVERVWELTHGHPFLTQQLCYQIWERAYDTEPNKIPSVTFGDVEAAIPGTLASVEATLEWLWEGLPSAVRVVAAAVANADNKFISQLELERLLHDRGVRIIIRELQNAPKLLQDWDLIEPVDDGYRFRVELLRRWIADRKPLTRVQEEIGRIQPAADNLFQNSRRHFQAGQLEQAIPLLRQAINLNPNHLQANQMLAEILLAQGQISEARQLLESVYKYQPTAAHHRLVQAVLLQAQAVEDEDEKLILYERVLQLEPHQSEAITKRQEIWTKRGDTAYAAGGLKAALYNYRQAGLFKKAIHVGCQLIGQFEEEGEYQEALRLAQRLHTEYPQEEGLPHLESLKQKMHLSSQYRQAIAALQDGNRQMAQSILAQIVSLKPDYQEATRYLHLAVTGIDVVDLQTNLVNECAGRRAAELDAQQKVMLLRQKEASVDELQDYIEKTARFRNNKDSSVPQGSDLISLWSPLDYLKLLWWLLIDPLQWSQYHERFGPNNAQHLGKWLIGTLIGLPIFTAVFILEIDLLFRSRDIQLTIVIWLIGGWALAWLLNTRFEDPYSDKKSFIVFSIVSLIGGIIAFGVVTLMAGTVASLIAVGLVVIGAYFLMIDLRKSRKLGQISWRTRIALLVVLLTQIFIIWSAFQYTWQMLP